MKTFGSIVLGFIMTIVVFVISLFACVRMFLSPITMSKVVNALLEEEGIVGPITEDFPELGEYLDEDKINKEYGVFFSDYIKYLLGVPNQKMPSLERLKVLLDEAIDEYVKETGKEFDYASYNEEYKELEASIETELVPDSQKAPEEVQMIIGIIYSDTIIMIFIIVVVGAILIDFLMRKEILVVSRHVGIVSLINSFIYGSIVLFIFAIETEEGDVFVRKIINAIGEIPLLIAVICLVLGIVLVVMSIMLRNKNNNRNNMNNGMYNNGYYQQQMPQYPNNQYQNNMYNNGMYN